ncbi:MAG: hypothetical protein QM820_44240 [Minicystis sp.]
MPAGSVLPDTGAPRIVRHFRDLPASIGGDFAADWPIVREALYALDQPPSVVPTIDPQSTHSPADFAVHVRANLRRLGEPRTPMQFWIGNTGSGKAPNYQVEFSDGSVQTYRHNGRTHVAPSFDPRKLRGPFPLAWP